MSETIKNVSNSVSIRNTFLAIIILVYRFTDRSEPGTCANTDSGSTRPWHPERRCSKTDSQSEQQAREAKPELVLQTGYNNLIGATRFVFSPDGRLLATTTMRSSTIKLWETATGRELRNLSGGTQSGMTLSPFVAFSRDSRLIAAAAGDNTVKVWDVINRTRNTNTREFSGRYRFGNHRRFLHRVHV